MWDSGILGQSDHTIVAVLLGTSTITDVAHREAQFSDQPSHHIRQIHPGITLSQQTLKS